MTTYKIINPIREEFIRPLKEVRKIEAKVFCSQFSDEQLRLINEEIKNENC